MSLKFKGNKDVSDILRQSKKIKKEDDIKQDEYKNVNMAGKTPAQIKFDLIRRKRQQTRVDERIKLTHKERIDKYNLSLSKLSDHYDIPRVGPG